MKGFHHLLWIRTKLLSISHRNHRRPWSHHARSNSSSFKATMTGDPPQFQVLLLRSTDDRLGQVLPLTVLSAVLPAPIGMQRLLSGLHLESAFHAGREKRMYGVCLQEHKSSLLDVDGRGSASNKARLRRQSLDDGAASSSLKIPDHQPPGKQACAFSAVSTAAGSGWRSESDHSEKRDFSCRKRDECCAFGHERCVRLNNRDWKGEPTRLEIGD